MSNDVNLNVLVTNIVSENNFSHCRLCLVDIRNKEQYVRFDDTVSLDPDKAVFQPLVQVLQRLLGDQLLEDVPGIDAVCMDCVDKTLASLRFIELCQSSTRTLHRIVDNLTNTLHSYVHGSGKDQALYIKVGEDDNEFIVAKKPRKKWRVPSSKPSFVCYECNLAFDNLPDLKVHNLVHHDLLTCEQCSGTFSNDSELALHEITEHKYKCPVCPLTRNSESSLQDHQNKCHTLYVCKDCGKSCKGLDKLQTHEAKHSTKNSCPKCGKTYTTKEFYSKHVELCLKNLIDPQPIRSELKKEYACDKCTKRYSTPGGLQVHNRFVHGNAKPHVCDQCGKSFTAPSYLRTHMVKHTGEKNFKCEICNNKFVSKEALLYHTRRHTGEKPYSCKYCDLKFVNASARAEHIKFKHVGPTLTCEICLRKFVTSNFLRQHMNRHYDPASKLYYCRNLIPPNIPGEQNMRNVKVINDIASVQSNFSTNTVNF